jgi:hypothetical protein
MTTELYLMRNKFIKWVEMLGSSCVMFDKSTIFTVHCQSFEVATVDVGERTVHQTGLLRTATSGSHSLPTGKANQPCLLSTSSCAHIHNSYRIRFCVGCTERSCMS